MLSFKEWSNGKTFPNKNKKGKKNVQSSYKRGSEVGYDDFERKATGSNQEIVANDVYVFPIV